MVFALFRCLIFGTDGLWNVISANSSVEIVRYAEQMNERNNRTQGEDRDWTNPSKCLVDKALEQWSTTRMRADNTSVVIVIIDPPGPPKRDVVRTTPQQFIVEKSTCQDSIEEEGLPIPTVITNPELNSYSLFDHRTNELTDLDKIALQNHSANTRGTESDEDKDRVFESPNFQSTYAAAYNPMIYPLADDPLAPVMHTDSAVLTDNQPQEEPYSLICLETGQTTTTGYYSPYDPSTSIRPHQYEQPNVSPTNAYSTADKNQFPSIATFLSQSCGIIQNSLDASEHNSLINNMFLPLMPPNTSFVPRQHEPMTIAELTASINAYEDSDEYSPPASPTPPLSSSCDLTIADVDADESIQIDEISSSSKENEANATPPTPLPLPSAQYHIPLLRSSIKSLMRTTRSSKLPRTPSFDSRTKKPKTIAKKVVATKAAPKYASTVVPSRVSARRTTTSKSSPHSTDAVVAQRTSLRSGLDLCKRTLCSKNTIGFKATKLNSSPPSANGVTKKSLLTPKATSAKTASSASTPVALCRSSRLRDKVRPSFTMLPSRPKLMVTSLSASARKTVAVAASTDRSPVKAKSCSAIASSTPNSTRSRFRKRLSR